MRKRNANYKSNTELDENVSQEKVIEGKSSAVQTKSIKIKCKNERQKEFIRLIDDYEISFCSGPAGCGKSYLSLAKALDYIQTPNNGYSILYIITPAVEVEEKLGALPGSLDDKLAPYLFSSYNLIDKIIGKPNREKMVSDGVIQPLALGFLRGMNIDNAVLIFEESQNASKKQMKTLLTRIGQNTKFIISGDVDQIDRFRDPNESGLIDAMERFKDYPKIAKFNFMDGDSVRNVIINDILKYY